MVPTMVCFKCGTTFIVAADRATLTDPNGSVITYSYTGRGQVASIVADGPPPMASFTYDAGGNRTTRTLENGITSTYTYNAAGRLTALSHGAGVEELTHTYDMLNRRTGETRSSAPARAFDYDLVGQLTAVNQSGGNATFAYDAVGNRTSVTGAPGAGSYTANNINQYTTAGGMGALTYDANGNLATGGGWTYTHNGNSRLVGVSGPGSVTATFGRDGRNRDVKRTINGTTTYLIYDGWNLVAEYNAAGTLTTQYIHGPQVDEILAKVTPTFKDANGTPLSGTTTGTRFLFTGREWLAALNLYDYRNRAYSAELGRFIQTDPIGFGAGDVNLYRYGDNNPINRIDPQGLQTMGALGVPKEIRDEMLYGGAEEAKKADDESRRILDAANKVPVDIAVELVPLPGPPGSKSFAKDVVWDSALKPVKDWLAGLLFDKVVEPATSFPAENNNQPEANQCRQ